MSSTITLRWRNRRTSVRVDEIVYVESYNRHLSVYTVSGKTEIVGKLGDFMRLLPENEFLSIHKSFTVNMKFITGINECGAVISDGTVLPVSVRKRKAAVEKFDGYCLERGEEKCLF